MSKTKLSMQIKDLSNFRNISSEEMGEVVGGYCDHAGQRYGAGSSVEIPIQNATIRLTCIDGTHGQYIPNDPIFGTGYLDYWKST